MSNLVANAALLATPLLACAVGCHLVQSTDAVTQESILKAARTSPDAVTLSIYWLRLPHTSDGADGGLWDHVQEDRLPVELRKRLADNGLRAGVVGVVPPDLLLRLLDPEGDAELDQSGVGELRKTGVSQRTRQLRSGQELSLNASPVIDHAKLSIVKGDETTHMELGQLQGVYVLEAARADDDLAWVSLLPTVQHGDPHLSFTQDDTGVIGYGATTRDTEAFPDLAVAADLAAGEMLLVTNLPGSASQLGGLFHTPPTDTGCERKAILVRVAATPTSRAFLTEK